MFNKKYVPTQEDDVMVKMKYTTFNGVNYIPQPGTPDDFLSEQVVIRREKSVSKILSEIKEAMEKLPEKSRRSLDQFVPLDASDDAPSETDPRTDDGIIPPQPGSIVVTRNGDVNRISFMPVSPPDIVGYRLYRTTDGQTFVRAGTPQVLMVNPAEPIFTDTAPGGSAYGYYVSAVDVAGRESVASKPVFADGQNHSQANQNGPGGLLPEGSPGGSSSPSKGPTPGGSSTAGKPTPTPAAPKHEPAEPEGLKAKSKGVSLQLTWTANPKADAVTEYNVYYSDTESGAYKIIGTSKGTEFIYFAATDDGYYKISAVNELGESPLTSAVHYTKP
jgi:penicillin-binding protein